MATRTATLRVKTKKERKPSPAWWRWTKRITAVLIVCILIGSAYMGFRFMSAYRLAQDMVLKLDEKMMVLEVMPSKIVSADGVTLYQISGEYRKPIGDFNKIPVNMRNAIVAAEDKRFWQHSGVDPMGIARAVFGRAKGSTKSGGGSTITMQLAKQLFSRGEQTFDRKMQDIALAIAIEQRYSKEQILTMYLDKVYFGSGAYGVQAASEIYFGKTVAKLTLGECAMIARCVQRPSDINPYKNPERSLDNRNLVLANMLEMATITQTQYDKAMAEKVHLRQKTAPELTVNLQHAPYFVQHVLESLHDKYNIDIEDLKLGGYTIHTTLDSKLEKVAEAKVRRIVQQFRGWDVTTAAFVVMDKDGQIKAEVGGLDYKKSNFNIVTHGARQPGSAFKPFIYSAGLAEGKVDIYGDLPNQHRTFYVPGDRHGWTPDNDNGKYSSSVSVRSAMMYSVNVAAANVMDRIGPDSAVQYANGAFGFSTQFRPYMSLALGAQDVHPIDMAQAYSVFMLRGNRATPYCITEIETPDGEDPIKVTPQIVQNVLSPEVADDIDALLRAVVAGGSGSTGWRAQEIPNARGKTGTTSDNKDAWFCGYTDGLIGIGWVANCQIDSKGNPHYRRMSHSAFGGTVTVPLWNSIMSYAHDHLAMPMADRPLADTFGMHGTGMHGGGGSSDGATPVEPDDPAIVPDTTDTNPTPGDYPDNPDKYPDHIPPPTDPTPPTGGGELPPPQLLTHRRR